MKIIRAKDKYHLDFAQREYRVLTDLLKLYPCVPPAHQPLSKSGQLADAESARQLLDEALAGQRAENKKRLQTLLANPHRKQETDTGFRLCLAPSDVEWLLQVLNDIRVGSWVLLGSPEDEMKPKLLNEKTAPHYWAMEMSGYFQAQLLDAVG